jgi:membrane associated rhomboid family serine protease
MCLIIPWQVDVPQDRYPFMNWLIIAGIIAAFIFETNSIMNREGQLEEVKARYADKSVEDVAKDFNVNDKELQRLRKSVDKSIGKIEEDLPLKIKPDEIKNTIIKRNLIEEYFVYGQIRPYMLSGLQLKGLFGYIWLHGGILHLLGNLLFLWTFGNAVCAKIGNIRYAPVYIGLGVIAGISHLIFAGGSVIGASGAINGIVGIFLVFFPQNEITCYWIFFPYIRQFSLSSYWMILFWFAFDILGAFMGGGGVAHFAHLGGFFAGAALAIVMLKTRMVVMEPRYEKSLLDFYEEWRHPPEPKPDGVFSNFQRDIEFAEKMNSPQVAPAAGAMPRVIDNFFNEEKMIIMDDPPPDEFIRFACPCGKKVKIPAKFAGKSGRCPACKRQIKIPG